MTPRLSRDGALLTVHVPIAFRKRGGRKLVLAPSGTEILLLPGTRVDSAFVKAIARAHRWKRMLESGAYASIAELAEAEKINQSYLCRVLRLSLLAPDIVEGALKGTLAPEFTLERAMKPVPTVWEDQRRVFLMGCMHTERKVGDTRGGKLGQDKKAPKSFDSGANRCSGRGRGDANALTLNR